MKTFQEFLSENESYRVPVGRHESEAKRHAARAVNFKGNDPEKYKAHRDAQKAHELAASTTVDRQKLSRKAVSASEYAADV